MAQTVVANLAPKLGLSKKALLLGAGFVTKPTVQVLSDAGIDITVGCRTLAHAEKLCSGINNTHAVALNVTDSSALDEAVKKVDIVISLIPYTFHVDIIKSGIRNKKNVVTTSYISPAMQELEKEVKEAGITVMNEIGVDPGVDHLYAVKMIDEVHRHGGKIKSFYSYCGGLPAPESSDNPLGYKFSWSSRGVLLALKNAAKFWKDGKVVDVPGEQLMASARPYHIYPAFNFVAYANRDSTPYKERYHIPEAENIVRGSLRYGVFPEFVRVLSDIGLLSDTPNDMLSSSNLSPPTWCKVLQALLSSSSADATAMTTALDARTKFASPTDKDRILQGMRWLDLFSEKPVTPRGNPLDTLCATLEGKMQYEAGERDMVMLQHKFEIEWKDGVRETRTSTLCEYGEKTAAGSTSAMAKLVGVPCGVAVKMVLDGTIAEKGILAPLDMKLAGPLMDELKKYGIEMQEKTVA